MKTYIFHDKLKIININPIYKRMKLFTNYTPISLLPAISKIFEKVIIQEVYKNFQEKLNI